MRMHLGGMMLRFGFGVRFSSLFFIIPSDDFIQTCF
jgi:hypothetical protein